MTYFYLTHNPMLNVAMQRFLERPDMAEKIAQGRWLGRWVEFGMERGMEYVRWGAETLGIGAQWADYAEMMGSGAVWGGSRMGNVGGAVLGAVGGAGIAYSTEKITEFLVSRAIQKIADGAESIFPGSGEQLIYETADIINITLSYTQAGRALAKMRRGLCALTRYFKCDTFEKSYIVVGGQH